MEQLTDEWFAARLGKVTASRIVDVVSKTKSGWGAARSNYASELIVERLTGQPTASFTSTAMQWGLDKEPDAIEAYEQAQLVKVTQVGFIDHPVIAMTGASPDGLVGDDGMVEVKCPNTKTHIETLRGREITMRHQTQMQWQMACADRQWCDFASYDPRLPEDMILYIERVERDVEYIEDLTSQVEVFLDEIAVSLDDLHSIRHTNIEENTV